MLSMLAKSAVNHMINKRKLWYSDDVIDTFNCPA